MKKLSQLIKKSFGQPQTQKDPREDKNKFNLNIKNDSESYNLELEIPKFSGITSCKEIADRIYRAFSMFQGFSMKKISQLLSDTAPVVYTDTLINNLNKDIQLEYSAAIQYLQHASMIKGIEFFAVQEELLKHADEEIAHAKKLNDWVAKLGGIPATLPEEIKTSNDSMEMLYQDLDGEMTAIKRYKQRIDQAKDCGEYGLVNDLMEILSDEEEHRSDLEIAVGK